MSRGTTRVALVAHDEENPETIGLVNEYEAVLSRFDLVATGTTGQRIVAETDLEAERKNSGPLGGDTQIGAEVAEDGMDAIVFLRDSLTAQPHDPDISALLRICTVKDVPRATTRASATYGLEGLDRDVEEPRTSSRPANEVSRGDGD